MKKKALIIILLLVTVVTLIISLSSNSVQAGTDVSAEEIKSLFNSYYYDGYYTKDTVIYLDSNKVENEMKSYFHANVTNLVRTTIYKDSELWMNAGEGTSYSGYGSKDGKLTQFTVSVDGIKGKESVISSLPAMEDYYLTLKDFALGEHTSAHSNNIKFDLTQEWTVENGVYSSTNTDVINGFRLFTAPGLLSKTEENANYFDFSCATVQEVDGKLVMKLWIHSTDAVGKVIDDTEVDGNNVLFSQATVVREHINISKGKQFVPTEKANANIYNTNFGYTNLTDGIFAESAGRFSTKENKNGAATSMDATMNLGANYELYNIRYYYYSWANWENDPFHAGADLKLETFNNGEWTTALEVSYSEYTNYLTINSKTAGDYWLEFDLDGIVAEKVRISSTGGIVNRGISFYEIEIIAHEGSKKEIAEVNVSEGKQFVPTAEANTVIWGTSNGYQTLTDGVISNDGGRFSTKTNSNGQSTIMDATMDLVGNYALSKVRFYYFIEWWTAGAEKNPNTAGADLKFEVFDKGVWHTVFEYTNSQFTNYLVINDANAGGSWLEFDLNGIRAERVRISSTGAVSGKSTSFYEVTVMAYEETKTENVFTGKQFVPTNEARAVIWADVNGYQTLTDGIFAEGSGRFSTKINSNGQSTIMDATIDLGGSYSLSDIRVYYYLAWNKVNDAELVKDTSPAGNDFKVEVYSNGTWITIIECNHADYSEYLVSLGSGLKNTWLQFDLGGIVAEKVRISSSSALSGTSTSIHEIECYGIEQ